MSHQAHWLAWRSSLSPQTARERAEEETEVANDAHDQGQLSYHFDGDGSLVISGRPPAEQGALVIAALQAARAALAAHARGEAGGTSAEAPASPGASAGAPGTQDGADGWAAANADALVAMASSTLATGTRPTAGGATHQVVVHVGVEDLSEDDHGGEKGTVVLGGGRLPVRRPRVRTVGDTECHLESYDTFASLDLLSQHTVAVMLAVSPSWTRSTRARGERPSHHIARRPARAPPSPVETDGGAGPTWPPPRPPS